MRFQTKIKDLSQINHLMEQLALSDESSYLWCHHDGRLVIYDARITSWDGDKRRLSFQLGKSASRLPLSSLTQLNLFHESLLIIFKSPIETHQEDELKLKAPESILKLAQAEDFLPELMAAGAGSSQQGVDSTDLELISQVLEVINTSTANATKIDNKNDTPKTNYEFAKKPDIKETTGTFAFSSKGVVEDSLHGTIKENTSGSKKMRIEISRPGSTPAIYTLSEVETHGVAFQTLVKGEFKIGDEIVVHSIFDSPLSTPLTAKIIVFNRPSEYAKHWRVEARFNVATELPAQKKKEIEKVGIKRLLGENAYSHEVIYSLDDMNTNGLILAEKRKGEFTAGDKLIISNLYGNPLKTPINAQIKSFQDTANGRLVTIEFVKPEEP